MTAFVWIIGAITVVFGMSAVVWPVVLKKTLVFLSVGRLIYIPGIIKGVIGVVFLVYARSCHKPLVIVAIGLLMAAGGLTVLVIDFSRIQKLMTWWAKRNDLLYRLWGLAAIVFGGLILYAGTPAR